MMMTIMMIADIFNPSINQLQVALAFYLDRVEMNQHDKSLGRTSFSPKKCCPGTARRQTHTGLRRTDCLYATNQSINLSLVY